MVHQVARTAKPVYKPRIRIEFVMNFRIRGAAFLTRLALYLPTLYQFVSKTANVGFEALLLARWMALTPASHIDSMAGIAGATT